MKESRLKKLIEFLLDDLLDAYDENSDMSDLVDNLLDNGFTKEELKEFKALKGLL